MRNGKKSRIRFRQSLFWDVDPKTIDPNKNAEYVIERILEFGELHEVKWMIRYYPVETIRNAMRESRMITDQSKFLWSTVI